MDGNREDSFDVSLDAPGPYGFRLTGGLGTNMPLRIGKVQEGSKASNSGVQVGQQVMKLQNQNTGSMTHKQAKNIIKTCGETTLDLTLQGKQKFVLLQPPLPPGKRLNGNIEDRPVPPAPYPQDIYFDEADSGLSLTPSVTSSVTDPESDSTPFPEMDNPVQPPAYESQPPILPDHPPPPPPPPLPDDDLGDLSEMVQMTSVGGANVKDEAIRSGLSCGSCSQDVKAKDMVVKVDGISWHVECLNCMECRMPLFNKKYNVRHGLPVCPHHL